MSSKPTSKTILPKLESDKSEWEKYSERNSNTEEESITTLIRTLTILKKAIHVLDLCRKSLELFNRWLGNVSKLFMNGLFQTSSHIGSNSVSFLVSLGLFCFLWGKIRRAGRVSSAWSTAQNVIDIRLGRVTMYQSHFSTAHWAGADCWSWCSGHSQHGSSEHQNYI